MRCGGGGESMIIVMGQVDPRFQGEIAVGVRKVRFIELQWGKHLKTRELITMDFSSASDLCNGVVNGSSVVSHRKVRYRGVCFVLGKKDGRI